MASVHWVATFAAAQHQGADVLEEDLNVELCTERAAE